MNDKISPANWSFMAMCVHIGLCLGLNELTKYEGPLHPYAVMAFEVSKFTLALVILTWLWFVGKVLWEAYQKDRQQK